MSLCLGSKKRVLEGKFGRLAVSLFYTALDNWMTHALDA